MLNAKVHSWMKNLSNMLLKIKKKKQQNMLWREICLWQLHTVRAKYNMNSIYSHQTILKQDMEDHSYLLYQ